MAPSTADVRKFLSGADAQVLGEAGGWVVAEVSGGSDTLAERLAADSGQSVSGWIYDSDFAYLYGADAHGRSFELLLGVPYSDDDEQLRVLEELASPSGRRDSAKALAAWSGGNEEQEEVLLGILEQEDVFVEETIAMLLRQLGLAELSPLLDKL